MVGSGRADGRSRWSILRRGPPQPTRHRDERPIVRLRSHKTAKGELGIGDVELYLAGADPIGLGGCDDRQGGRVGPLRLSWLDRRRERNEIRQSPQVLSSGRQ